MPFVEKVSIDTVVVPGLRYRPQGTPVRGQDAVPAKYFFGHSVTVQIVVDDIAGCRLYWAEKTNVPIVGEQSEVYFVDMHKLYPQANTYVTWNAKKRQGGNNGPVYVTDIPAMPGGSDKPDESHRWLEIVAVVHDARDDSARKAHFRQDLLYYPAGGQGEARARFEHYAEQGNFSLANLEQSGDGVRNYAYTVVADDVPLQDPASDIPRLFHGAPDNDWI